MGFWLVYAFGVNVVWYDHFTIADLLRTASERPLGLGDFFAQHNEHRVLFPKLTLYLLAKLSGFNNFWEMYFIEFCLLLVMLIYLREYRRTEGCKSTLYFFPVAFLVFSPVQFVNMLWGFQLSMIFALLFSAVSFHLLSSYARGKRASRIFMAAGTGVIASFSTANGLFVWPAGLIALLAANRDKRKSLHFTIWAAVGAVSWALFFHGLEHPAHHPPATYVIRHPLEGIVFVVSGLGGWANASLAPVPIPSAIVGSALVLSTTVVSFILIKKRLLAKYAFWASLSAFSILNFLSIAIGRASMGVPMAMDSRYATFSLPLVISLYITAVSLINSGNRARLLRLAREGFLVLFSFVFVPYIVYTGVQSAELFKYRREVLKAILLNFDRLPEDTITSSLYPDPVLLVKNAAFLKANKLNAFSGEPEGGVVFVLKDRYFIVEMIGGMKALPGKIVRINHRDGDVRIRAIVARNTEATDAEIGLALGGTPIGSDFVEPKYRQILIGVSTYRAYSLTSVVHASTMARGSYKLRAALRDRGGNLSYSNESIDVEVE